MIWISNEEKACTYFNKQWLDFTGRSMEEELGMGWAAGVHSEDYDRCLEIYAGNFDERKPFEMEYRLRAKDGAYRWVLDKATPRFSSDQVFLGYIGSSLDITERKEAEAEVLRLNQELEARVIERTAHLEQEIAERVRAEMEGSHALRVPLEVSAGRGATWFDVH